MDDGRDRNRPWSIFPGNNRCARIRRPKPPETYCRAIPRCFKFLDAAAALVWSVSCAPELSMAAGRFPVPVLPAQEVKLDESDAASPASRCASRQFCRKRPRLASVRPVKASANTLSGSSERIANSGNGSLQSCTPSHIGKCAIRISGIEFSLDPDGSTRPTCQAERAALFRKGRPGSLRKAPVPCRSEISIPLIA